MNWAIAPVVALLLLCTPVQSGEHEVGVGYSQINQRLDFKQPIHFNMDSVLLKYTYWTDYNIGLTVNFGRSLETVNKHKLDLEYTNSVQSLWRVQLLYKYHITDYLSCLGGAGITEYRTEWKVNGELPEWAYDVDSHKPSYVAGCRLDYNSYSIEATYGFDYEKDKKGYGYESTDNVAISFIKRF